MKHDVEAGALGGALVGTVAALVVIGGADLPASQTPPAFGLVLWAWYTLWGALLALPLALAFSFIGRVVRREAWASRACGLLGFFALGLLAVRDAGRLPPLFSVDGPLRYRAL